MRNIKYTKVFFGDVRLKDIAVGTTKWERFVFKFVKFLRTIAIIAFLTGAVTGAYKVGTMTTNPKTVFADREVIKEVEMKAPVLERIAKCEAGGKHKKNGQVIFKANTNGTVDVGKYQINSIWNITATKMNLDLTKEEDNEAFAKWLYANKGTEPWFPSKKCWSL